MINRIVIASVLAASSVSGSAQEAVRTVYGSTSQWSRLYLCTLNPVSNFTIKNTGDMPTGRSRNPGGITMTGVDDLRVSGTPGGSPTITAHAINTKGTGVNSGRSINEIGISVKSKRMSNARSPIRVACVTSQLAGDAAGQKVDYAVIRPSRAAANSVGWTCSVSGSEEQPVFSIGLLVPTMLGQAESPLGKAASWSWGVSNSGYRVSIVSRGTAPRGSESFACTSRGSRTTDYDLVMMKKA